MKFASLEANLGGGLGSAGLLVCFVALRPKSISFEHPKHMVKLMEKEIIVILGAQTILILTYDT